MFEIFLSSHSKKFLKRCEEKLKKRILKKIDELKENPFPSDVKRIIGRNEKIFRIRVGDYRIQYRIFHEKNLIFISDIDKRAKAY